MKFKISRATDTRNERPCKNAEAEIRTTEIFVNPKDAVNNIHTKIDIVEWFIELNSIEDINILIEEVGDIIIYHNSMLPGNRITIYDTYIE